MWEEHLNSFKMRAGHGKDMRGAIDQRGRNWLAAKTADVHAFLFADLHRIETWWLAAHGVHPSRGNFNVSPISKQTPKQPFRDGTAANVTCADKEDVFHDSGGASARDSNLESNKPKSIWRRGSNLATCLESSNRAFPKLQIPIPKPQGRLNRQIQKKDRPSSAFGDD